MIEGAGSNHAEQAIALARDGAALVQAGRVQSGIALFIEAVQLCPSAPGILHHMANALLSIGRADEAIEAARYAYEAAPELPATQSNLLTLLLYSPTRTPEVVAAAHRQWGLRFQDAERPRVQTGGALLRVGYLSSCFHQNPEYFFIEPILRHHDRDRVKVFCYSSGLREDDFTGRLRLVADHWRELKGLTDVQAAQRMRDDGIDVMVDCSGHYSESRLAVLALRPAPVQVSLPTYPATTGLRAVDYRITDYLSDPPGLTEHLHTEQLVRLPHVFLCYSQWHDYPDVGTLPADRNGRVTFGCFNRLDKLNDAVLEAWAAILQQVPDARLLIHSTFHGHAEAPAEHREPLLRRLAALGIQPERIRFEGARPLREYFEVRNDVDLTLDPFPFPGLTTTCDALWMGTPVVTLAAGGHLGRTGATLLNAVGLPDWVAGTREEYVRLAVNKARDLPALRKLRQELRGRMEQSALMDARGYTRALEHAYSWMVREVR